MVELPWAPRKQLCAPQDMTRAPLLGPIRPGRQVRRRSALLINPFYPKDPRARQWLSPGV